MSCVNPMRVTASVLESGEVRYTFDGSAKKYDYDFDSPSELSSRGSYSFLVPCRKCYGCVIDRAKIWTDRLVLEYLDSDQKAIFLTLTYNDNHLPIYEVNGQYFPTLCKDDVQKFLKRLRYFYPDRKLRYYCCGEYGPSTHRPHYHIIVFGLSLSDFNDLSVVGVNELRQPHFSSLSLASIWKNGFITIGECTSRSIKYCARYVYKKNFNFADEFSFLSDDFCDDEFFLFSRRPGLGYGFAERLLSSGVDSFSCSFPDGVYSVRVPLVLIKSFCDKNPDFAPDIYSSSIDSRIFSCYSNLVGKLDALGVTAWEFFERSANDARKINFRRYHKL